MTWKNILLGCLALCFTAAGTGHAHYLWVDKSDDVYTVSRGVPPDRMDPYRPEAVRAFVAFGPDGGAVPPDRIHRFDDPDRVRFQSAEDIASVGVTCDWGHRVNTTQGKKLMGKKEAEKAGFRVIDAFFSTQCARVFFKQGTGAPAPLGMAFELVPLADPARLALGEELPVQAVFGDRPLAGVTLSTRDGTEITTDAGGIGRARITEKGLQLLTARHKVPVTDDPELDHHVFTAFIVFEVP